MRMQEVREELEAMAHDVRVPRPLRRKLRTLADATRRRPVKRQAPAKSQPVTDAMRRRIRAAARRYPKLTQFDIAAMFGVNQGRVSEALRGKRS